ncbi:flagellar protein [Rhodosalinus halophilus]|uniref:Flagellar protein n=2 Tax=Rhodosalinus halophilus TaxID=2259333 RepID=A0A365U9G6_9RHOB|nr:flagellar protein [Rhodosalinus halophilus]
MSFQPVLPLGGLAGWRFLQRTMPAQQSALNDSPPIARNAEHFRARIGEIATPAELVEDRRLLTVALGAFGLQEDIDNRFFIRRILEEGTARNDALANRLADKRYAVFARAFAFDAPQGPATRAPGFADDIVARFERQSFEVAIGRRDEDMRLALFADRELRALARADSTPRTKWFRVMGTPPLRAVVETALGLPKSFGQQDLDRQLETFRDRSARLFGSPDIAAFADPEVRERVIRQFLLQSEIGRVPATTPGATALALLESAASAGRSGV